MIANYPRKLNSQNSQSSVLLNFGFVYYRQYFDKKNTDPRPTEPNAVFPDIYGKNRYPAALISLFPL